MEKRKQKKDRTPFGSGRIDVDSRVREILPFPLFFLPLFPLLRNDLIKMGKTFFEQGRTFL
ncbi:MAG: hypothetical protein C6W57_03040 [Caldibacillus debilis]|nr:MAG: hypothetical protein C6W57_03040 [Caldibacillus debilis]